MTFEQQTRVLDLVEALLSGEYRHGKGLMYNPQTDTYDFLGVACMLNHIKWDGQFFVFPNCHSSFPHDWLSNKTVPAAWFAEMFGLRRPVGAYTALNDHSRDYLPIVALLLNEVPVTSRRQRLHDLFMERVNESIRSPSNPSVR